VVAHHRNEIIDKRLKGQSLLGFLIAKLEILLSNCGSGGAYMSGRAQFVQFARLKLPQ
jgi:hypothetical protein